MMSRFPGASLLHPLFLVSLLVLLINDHIAKDLYPGLITGKLSDFSGLLVLPVLAFVAVEVGAKATRRRLPGARVAAALCIVSAIGFALVKSVPWANEGYRFAIGAIRWPLQALTAAADGTETPGVSLISVVPDEWDIIAIVAVIPAYLILRLNWAPRSAQRSPSVGTGSRLDSNQASPTWGLHVAAKDSTSDAAPAQSKLKGKVLQNDTASDPGNVKIKRPSVAT